MYVKIQALLKLQNDLKRVMWEFPHMAMWTCPQIFFSGDRRDLSRTYLSVAKQLIQ